MLLFYQCEYIFTNLCCTFPDDLETDHAEDKSGCSNKELHLMLVADDLEGEQTVKRISP